MERTERKQASPQRLPKPRSLASARARERGWAEGRDALSSGEVQEACVGAARAVWRGTELDLASHTDLRFRACNATEVREAWAAQWKVTSCETEQRSREGRWHAPWLFLARSAGIGEARKSWPPVPSGRTTCIRTRHRNLQHGVRGYEQPNGPRTQRLASERLGSKQHWCTERMS
eukprot:6206177-Pleurochrysis_carterae.AAC.4